jgi:Photosynthetic reaction centre cytochrome C subunit
MIKKLKVLIVLIFITGCALVFTRSGEMQTVEKPRVQTAGQKFRNIKVLNDMPADQLGKTMNMFSAALGVDCNFCHISETEFEKDGKKEKETARKMIQMTMSLNKDFFNGRTEVSCNTCHQGHEHPQTAFMLPSPASPPERPAEGKDKPTVDAILDNYVKGLGGKAALDKIKTRMIKAQRIEADGKAIEAEEVYQKAPNKSLMTTAYGKYIVTEGYDGANAWKWGEGKEISLYSDEAEQIKREAELFSPADLKSLYKQLTYANTDRIGTHEVYVVRAVTASGQRERLYFDMRTGLLLRRAAFVPTVLGNFQYQVDYEDYKAIGGVKVPMTVRTSMPNLSWTRRVLEVKNNIPIDDAKFSHR